MDEWPTPHFWDVAFPRTAHRWHDKEVYDQWAKKIGSRPILLVAEKNYSKEWEHKSAEVFRLKNGAWLYVEHNGCSCYNTGEDADLHPVRTREEAFAMLIAYMRRHNDNNYYGLTF